MFKMDAETVKILNQCMLKGDERNGWYNVTPELAKRLLIYNKKNYRVINKNVLDKYAKDMRNGLWQKNGEPIIFNKDGVMNNGQHRLNGIIKSGVPVTVYLIFDADPSDIYDNQYKRTNVQILRAMGYSVGTVTPATAKAMLIGKFARMNIGDGQVLKYCIDHIDCLRLAENIVVTGGRLSKKASCMTIVYCLLRTGEMSERDMRDFFKCVNTGKKNGLKKDIDSAKTIRKYFLSNPYGTYDERNRMLEYVYKALMDFRSDVHHEISDPYTADTNLSGYLINHVQCMDGNCSFNAA